MRNRILFLATTILIFSIYSCKNASNNSKDKASSTEDKNIPIGINIGNKAPGLEYPSPEGETISLSSLKGKVVLIDFWASWCPPCRMENPNLVATYQRFKDKEFKNGSGFTVYGVSLDKSKDAWIKAISDDNLTWTHVSDLGWWNSQPAAIYQINSIPSNVLIDGNGIILAKNLRGQALDQALASILKN